MKCEIKIEIDNLRGNWDRFSADGTHIYLRGYIYNNGSIINCAADIYRKFNLSSVTQISSVKKGFLKNNGSFTLIIVRDSDVIVITDIIRSKPAFIIRRKCNQIIITDNLEYFSFLKLNPRRVINFCSSISVFGSNNCYENVYTCQSGEIITIRNGDIKSERYFEFIPNIERPQKEIHEFVEEFNQVMESTIDRMIKSAQDVNNWIIPLSGGHDSRVIANSFRKAGVENVICYSYGTPENSQSKVSQQVANAAGYSWHFVEYTENKWSDLHNKGFIDEYINSAFQGVSVPHLLDFLAVHELKKESILKDRDVFVPGHALDFVAGSHLDEVDFTISDRQNAIERVINKFSNFDFNAFLLEDAISNIYDNFDGHPSQFQEYLNWQERQTKFIVNSCMVYDFFGFNYRLPFWDREVVEFWMQISRQDRLNRNLFLRAEREGILLDDLAGIPFEDEINSTSKSENLIQKFKMWIPHSVKTALLRITGKKQTLAEGMNMIYANCGNSVEEIIGPLEDFPEDTHLFIRPYLKRYPYQINPNHLTSLYTIRRAMNNEVSDDK